MALVPKFNINDVKKQMEQYHDKIEQAATKRLMLVGENFVANARSTDTYKDRTGNLRSSIGYIVIKNGAPIIQSFEGKTETGKQAGLNIALNAAKKFPTGLGLIVVAGMGYAAAVESRNYDVLTGSSLLAETELKESFHLLQSKILNL